MNTTHWTRLLLLLAVFLVGACGSNPMSAEDLGLIEVHNTAEAPVSAWRYTICGQDRVYEVAIDGPGGTIPQGFFASFEEFGGTCTNHTFELTNGRTIVVNNIIVVRQSTVTITLTPP
jgi:hypothetical protein